MCLTNLLNHFSGDEVADATVCDSEPCQTTFGDNGSVSSLYLESDMKLRSPMPMHIPMHVPTLIIFVIHASLNMQVSCETYCNGIDGAPWNGELPSGWNGATCVSTSDPSISCTDIPGVSNPVYCVCTPSGLGWAQSPTSGKKG